MANISSAVVDLTFSNEDGEELVADLSLPQFAKFRELFGEMSYQGGGDHLSGNKFALNGRWSLTGNLGWTDIITAYCEELKKQLPTVKYIIMAYRETEWGMYFLAEGIISLDVDTLVYDDSESRSYNFDDYGIELGKPAPKEEAFQTADEYFDAHNEWMMELEEQFLFN